MKSSLITILCIFVFGWVASFFFDNYIGIPKTSEESPWNLLRPLLFWFIILCPLSSLIIFNVIKIKKPSFITSGEQLTYFALAIYIIMLLAWYMLELSIPLDYGMRLGIPFILMGFIFQILFIAISVSFYSKV